MELSPFLFGLYKLAKYAIYPFTWLTLAVGAVTVLAFLPASPRRLRWIQILSVLACVVIFISGSPLVAGKFLGLVEGQAQPLDRSGSNQFDAIVVLGGGVQREGTLRPRTELTDPSMRRTTCGSDLFREGWAPRLVLTGGDASIFGQGPKESIEMKKLALRLGVPEGTITVETRSRTTYESAVATRRMLGQASVLLVTSASHMPRALGLFRKQGLKPGGYPCGYMVQDRPGDWSGTPLDLLPSVGALTESTKAINELVGTVVYWLIGKI